MTRRRHGHPGHTRRTVAVDSDSSTDDSDNGTTQGQGPTLTDPQKYESMKAIAMADLGTSTRDHITSVDFRGSQPVHLRAVLAARECNQEGTDAALRAASNRPSLTDWANFGNSSDAKEDIIEEIPDIAAGQSHRNRGKEERRIQELLLGRPLTLQDTYDDHQRRGLIPTSRLGRGGSHVAATGRGNFSGGRGGSNAERGPGRRSVAVNRPLDPAVDPDRVYAYKNKGPRPRNVTATMVNNTVSVTAPATRTIPRGKRNNATMNGIAHTQNAASASTQAASLVARHSRPTSSSPKLASPGDFMAAVRSRVPPVKLQPPPSIPSESTSTQPTERQAGLLASKYATTPVVDQEPVQTHRLSRDEFRDPDLSPDNLTDALPSTGDLSITSPSMVSDGIAEDATACTGLAILDADMGDVGISTVPGPASDTTEGKAPDLMDIEIPEFKAEVLVPTPQASSPTEAMVSIPKTEAEIWAEVKALLNAGDIGGLRKHLKFNTSNVPTQAPSPKPVTNLKDGLSVANGYLVDSSKVVDIIGDKNLPRGTGTRTTTSLAGSKWAPGPGPARGVTQLTVVNEAAPANVADPFTMSANGVASMPSTMVVKNRVNPFVPKRPNFAPGDAALDYGEPSKVKQMSDTSASVLSQPNVQANLDASIQYNFEARREQKRAMMGERLQQIRESKEQLGAGEDLPVGASSTVGLALRDLPAAEPLVSVPKSVRPTAPSSISTTSRSGRSSGFLASKLADPEPAPSARSIPALHNRSTNKSPQKPADRAGAASGSTIPAKTQNAIFGDSRVLRQPQSGTAASRFVNTHPRSTGLFDVAVATNVCQPPKKSVASAQRTIGSGGADADSDESEL